MCIYEGLELNLYEQRIKLNAIGGTFKFNNNYSNGLIWIYKNKDFCFVFTSINVLKEFILNLDNTLTKDYLLISSYISKGNCELLDLKTSLSEGYSCIGLINNNALSLNEISHFEVFSILYSENMCPIDLQNKYKFDKSFMKLKNLNSLSKICTQVLNCDLEPELAEIFFDAKTREFLSISLNEIYKKKISKKLPEIEKEQIYKVAHYIDENYAMDITQKNLSEIGLMSPTKLKAIFKLHFGASVTEYIQRRRIEVGKELLINTNLNVSIIANSVGYSSPSRFSELYKRFEGLTPSQTRKKHKGISYALDIKI
ncbi:MAG: helix-turn-helix transcriptional regulator [Tissierellia bacterium]|nr:helix-turn-helix transcriptional regulator [Tissierellia bacterium]